MLYAAELTWSCQKGVGSEYQCAISRMARPTLGTFRSTPQGIIAAVSGLTPARALSDHRQARFAQRLLVSPQYKSGPEEVLEREGTAITSRLRAATGTRPGETVEPQVWSEDRAFPGSVCIDSVGSALAVAQGWETRDTIWANGSRLDSGGVGAICAWNRGRESGPAGASAWALTKRSSAPRSSPPTRR